MRLTTMMLKAMISVSTTMMVTEILIMLLLSGLVLQANGRAYGWGTFSGFGDDSYTVDGKTISTISWQQVSYEEQEGPFSPSTLIHETGHALGLL